MGEAVQPPWAKQEQTFAVPEWSRVCARDFVHHAGVLLVSKRESERETFSFLYPEELRAGRGAYSESDVPGGGVKGMSKYMGEG
jgi:hypothetical protein